MTCKKWIYLERNTLYRQNMGHLRMQETPKYGIVLWYAADAAKSLQSCLTLCDPIPGILQARILEWVAISFSNA